ncbi:MAG: substrate-binding domain-containing protein, partial [Acidimicrobiia bacterium]
ITDPFFAGAIEALSSEAMKLGYNVVLGNAHSRVEEAIALRAILETRHCDALVVLGDVSDQPSLIRDLHDATVPVVAMWQGSHLEGVHSVNVDNRTGIDAVLEHLTSLGHERIAYISETKLGDLEERQAAFVDFFTQHVLPLDPGYVRHARNNHGGGGEALTALLDLANPPTAVVASTDVLAIGALHTAHRSGLAVPDDISITGFDDIAMAGFTVPALTTVRMPTVEMVGAALEIVIESLKETNEGRSGEAQLTLQPSLVIRDSTGNPRVRS